MDVEEEKYQSDAAVSEILQLLTYLFKQTTLPNSHPRILSPLIIYSWQLLHSKEPMLVENAAACLLCLRLLPALHEHN